MQLVCTEAFILISISSAVFGSQLMNSYPLAIDFDGFKPIPQVQNRPTYSPYSNQHQRLPQEPIYYQYQYQQQQQQQSGRIYKNKVILNSYQGKTQIVAPSRGNLLMQPTTSVSAVVACDNCKPQPSSNYNRKRTLGDGGNSERLSSQQQELNIGNKTISGPQSTNSSYSNDAKKLLLIRQKMIDMQGRNTNVSIEDTNWKIAANCLSNQFGPHFIRNRDVKCASSQVVLSLSRMQRAGCKYCDSYFHCEGFSNSLKRCKDNYDVQETLNVMRECQGLTNGDFETLEATRDPMIGVDCKKKYLCNKNCMYNPIDGTCPRNNCFAAQSDTNLERLPYKSYLRSHKGRPLNIAYPAGSPLKDRILAAELKQQPQQ